MFRSYRRGLLILAALAILAASAGGLAYWHHHRYKHVAVHEPGMIIRSAWVDPDVMAELIEEYQIRTVVNLCTPGEMGEQRWVEERRAVRNAGARLIELPMPTTVDANDPLIARHLQVLADPNNYPMLVHCQHGVTRTAKLLTIYDIAFRGLTAEQSLKRQPLFGREEHNVNVRAFAHNFEKQHRRLYPTATAKRLDVLRQ